MPERYTSDIPATPDPDYEWVNPESQRDYLERALDDVDTMSENMRSALTRIVEKMNSKEPETYDWFVERFFMESHAQTFIDQHAVYDDDGRLNLDMTSAKIGIPYVYGMTDEKSWKHGEIVGLKGDQPITIYLTPGIPLQHITYGHEIGHYFWQKIMEQPRARRIEENFCEYFGRRMAMPLSYLEEYKDRDIDEATLSELMSRFRMDLNDTILSLMEAGYLPPRVAVDSYYGKTPNKDYSEKVFRGVICLHCAQVGGDYNCPEVDTPTPLFDFTDRAWADKVSHKCLGENLHKPDIMSTLTKYYVANEVQLVLFRPGTDYDTSDQETLPAADSK